MAKSMPLTEIDLIFFGQFLLFESNSILM